MSTQTFGWCPLFHRDIVVNFSAPQGVPFFSKSNVPKYFKIRYSKRVSANSNSCKAPNYTRLYSIFNTALILFNLVYESPHYYNLKFNFKLYDI